MTSAYDENCQAFHGKKPERVAWWTKELTTLKREAARRRTIYRRYGTEQNKQEARAAENKYRYELRKVKGKPGKSTVNL